MIQKLNKQKMELICKMIRYGQVRLGFSNYEWIKNRTNKFSFWLIIILDIIKKNLSYLIFKNSI